MTPRDAERLIHRRVRALAAARSPEPSPVEVSIALAPSEALPGRWAATAYGTTKAGVIVRVAAHDPDPTGALLALPGALAAAIDALIEDLRHGLREGDDLPVEESPAPAAQPVKLAARAHSKCRASQAAERVRCGLCGGYDGEHQDWCRNGGER